MLIVVVMMLMMMRGVTKFVLHPSVRVGPAQSAYKEDCLGSVGGKLFAYHPFPLWFPVGKEVCLGFVGGMLFALDVNDPRD